MGPPDFGGETGAVVGVAGGGVTAARVGAGVVAAMVAGGRVSAGGDVETDAPEGIAVGSVAVDAAGRSVSKVGAPDPLVATRPGRNGLETHDTAMTTDATTTTAATETASRLEARADRPADRRRCIKGLLRHKTGWRAGRSAGRNASRWTRKPYLPETSAGKPHQRPGRRSSGHHAKGYPRNGPFGPLTAYPYQARVDFPTYPSHWLKWVGSTYPSGVVGPTHIHGAGTCRLRLSKRFPLIAR